MESVLESPSNIGINIENFRLENSNYSILVWMSLNGGISIVVDTICLELRFS